MTDLDKAVATQLRNLEVRAGKSLAELTEIVRSSGLSRHGELVAMLKATHGMGHGDANLLVHTVRKADDPAAPASAPGSRAAMLDHLYVGPKAVLRPIHERLLAEMDGFGTFDEALRKTYVSYRRKKQFAMIGPATRTQVEAGLNMKDVEPTDRLVQLPPGQMCNYKVRLADPAAVDAELIGWLRRAYEAAG